MSREENQKEKREEFRRRLVIRKRKRKDKTDRFRLKRFMSIFRGLFGGETSGDNLRIIITRHGERADLALGNKWVVRAKNNGGRDPRVSYLTPRDDFNEWNYDPPLTITGERQSMSLGKKLLALHYPIDYCYSSPAYRSIQTANGILKSQGRKSVAINIEPGLFECPSWYVGTPLSFIPPEYLYQDRHFNINVNYKPIYSSVDVDEEETRYYKRSRQLIDAITKVHKNQGGTILLSGHGGSIEAVTRGMVRRRARPEYLLNQANRVDYCNFAILERDARTKQWSVHTPRSSENPHGGFQSIQSSIPLYSVTSHSNIRIHPMTDTARRYRRYYRAYY